MTKQRIAPDARVMTPEEVAAWNATQAAKRTEKAARAARRAELATPGEPGPAAILDALAVGASHVFPKYKKTTQTSSAIRAAYIRTGARFESSLARDLVTGESVIGVTVRRIS